MPRFFFDICAGDTLIVDEAGEAMHDVEEAVAAAQRLPPIIQRAVEPDGADNLIDVTIRDETGRAIAMTAMSVVTQRFGHHDAPQPCPPAAAAQTSRQQFEAATNEMKTLRATARTLTAAAAANRSDTARLIRDVRAQVARIRDLVGQAVPSPWVEATWPAKP